jgi:hypothetical protein
MSSGVNKSGNPFPHGRGGEDDKNFQKKPTEKPIQWVALAAIGNLTSINDYLRNGFSINPIDRIKVLKAAARQGRVEVILRLLEEFKIPDNDRTELIKAACENGHVNVIERLLVGFEISQSERGNLLKEAAKNGQAHVITCLLRNGQINEIDLMYAYLFATQKGQESVIQTLLQNSPNINHVIRGRLVIEASGGGHLSIINMLLENGATISQNLRCEAIIKAADSGNANVILRLLEDEDKVLQDTREKAIVAAASKGHISVVAQLMRDRSNQIVDIKEMYLIDALNAHMNARHSIKYTVEELGIVFLENSRGLSTDFILYLHQLMDEEDGLLRIPIFSIIYERPLDFLRIYCQRGFPEIKIVDPSVRLPDHWLQKLLEILSLTLIEQKLITSEETSRFLKIQLPLAKTDEQKETLYLFAQLLTHLYNLSKESGLQIKIPFTNLLKNMLFSIGKNPEEILESIDGGKSINEIWKNPKNEEDMMWKQSILDAFDCINQGIGHDFREALENDRQSVIRDFFSSEYLE